MLPSWDLVSITDDPATVTDYQHGIQKVEYTPGIIDQNTNYGILYFYDNDDSMQHVYGTENLQVMTIGRHGPDFRTNP